MQNHWNTNRVITFLIQSDKTHFQNVFVMLLYVRRVAIRNSWTMLLTLVHRLIPFCALFWTYWLLKCFAIGFPTTLLMVPVFEHVICRPGLNYDAPRKARPRYDCKWPLHTRDVVLQDAGFPLKHCIILEIAGHDCSTNLSGPICLDREVDLQGSLPELRCVVSVAVARYRMISLVLVHT